MYCPICGTAAEDITDREIDGQTVQCSVCGEYDIARSVLSDERWASLDADGRRAVLDKARQQSQPGQRPKILTDMLSG